MLKLIEDMEMGQVVDLDSIINAREGQIQSVAMQDIDEVFDKGITGEGQIESIAMGQKEGIEITAFAFEKGKGTEPCTTSRDILVYIHTGVATVKIGDELIEVKKDQMVAMPANIAHQVTAKEDMKMLFISVKEA
ncbi:cupin domain-containing protein [Terrisporobacter sp.]